MSLDNELKHYDVCIRRWKDKLIECINDKNYEEASFYARAVGNEYTRLSLTLEAERRRVESGSDQAHSPLPHA